MITSFLTLVAICLVVLCARILLHTNTENDDEGVPTVLFDMSRLHIDNSKNGIFRSFSTDIGNCPYDLYMITLYFDSPLPDDAVVCCNVLSESGYEYKQCGVLSGNLGYTGYPMWLHDQHSISIKSYPNFFGGNNIKLITEIYSKEVYQGNLINVDIRDTK